MRRFPWKSPKLSDPSFKNFASSPNPYSPDLSISRKSTTDSSITLTNTETQLLVSGSHVSPSDPAVPVRKQDSPPPAPINKGPMKLLNRLTPKTSRPLIGRMLDLHPKTRAGMQDIWNDDWFKGLKRCEIVQEREPDGTKKMVARRAGTHVHVLVGPTGEDVTPSGTSVKKVSVQTQRSAR
jgi:serine/threonine protein kinase